MVVQINIRDTIVTFIAIVTISTKLRVTMNNSIISHASVVFVSVVNIFTNLIRL